MASKKECVEIDFPDLVEDDMGSILRTYNEINQVKKALEKKTEVLKDKIRIMLKEKKWNTFMDNESKISVTLSVHQKESVNKNALKMLLNEEQYGQVITKMSVERLLIITPEDRARLKKYGKK